MMGKIKTKEYEIYKVAFFGEAVEGGKDTATENLDLIIRKLMSNHEFLEFYVENKGDYSEIVTKTINFYRYDYLPNGILCMVSPQLQTTDNVYDKIILVGEEGSTDLKVEKQEVLEWLVDNCDALIVYVKDERGEGYKYMAKALERGKSVINLYRGL